MHVKAYSLSRVNGGDGVLLQKRLHLCVVVAVTIDDKRCLNQTTIGSSHGADGVCVLCAVCVCVCVCGCLELVQ